MGAYIINISNTVDRIIYVNVGPDGGRTYISSHRVEDLTPYTEPDLEQVRKEAYEQGRKDGKIEGQAETWVCAKKIAYMDSEKRKKIFGENLIRKIQDIYSASECIEKIRQYEQEKEEQIQVGDEVISPNGKGVVTEITDIYVRIMYAKGSGQVFKPEDLTKTGRHFLEIAEVLQKMKEN